MDLRLSPAQLAIQEMVRDFVKREVKPMALAQDRIADPQQRFPLEVLRKASQLGLRTLALASEYGGGGADTLTHALACAELAVGDVSVAATLSHTSFLAQRWFGEVMNAEQRQRFLPGFLTDDLSFLSIAQHEPDTDVGWDYFHPTAAGNGLRTTAVQDGSGDWIINGSKNFITNGSIAKLIAVQARTDATAKGLAGRTFFVPGDTPGLTRREHDKLGRRIGSNAMLFFDGVRVPAENVADRQGSVPGQSQAGELGRTPVYMTAWTYGVGQAAYEAALEYAKLRVQGGKPIVQHQAVGIALAEMAADMQAARAILWKAAWGADHPEAYQDGSLPNLPLAAIARVHVAEAVARTAARAVMLFGGMGVMNEMPVQKYLRDAITLQHGAFGTNDIAKLKVAELVAGFRRAAAPVGAGVGSL